MDAGQILVAVLTSAAVGWLIWVEVHSRRNAAAQSARLPAEAADSKAGEEGVSTISSRARRRDKASARSA
jgi:hypothetical protein